MRSAVRRAEPLRELDHLLGPVQLEVRFAAELAGELGDPALDPPPLGLERERCRVTGGQRILDLVEPTGRDVVEEGLDLSEDGIHVRHGRDREGSPTIMDSGVRRGMGRAAHLGRRAGPRPWAVIALAAALLAPGPARAAAPLEARLAKALAVPHVQSAQTGAVAIDLRTGRQVFALNAQRGFLPASTEKLALAFAALHDLGSDFKIETDVLGDGALDGTTWRGELVLKGFGDPTLSRADLRVLARGVRAFGIRRVTGGVVGDESYFDSRRVVSGWKPSYLIEESPPLSALIVDRGRVRARDRRQPRARRGAALPNRAARGRRRRRPRRARRHDARGRLPARVRALGDARRSSSATWASRATTSPRRCSSSSSARRRVARARARAAPPP